MKKIKIFLILLVLFISISAVSAESGFLYLSPCDRNALGKGKIIEGEYKDAIDICRVVGDIRLRLPKEIKENMSKPGPEMYEKLFEKIEV